MNPVPGIQSALHPQGPHADALAALAWVLIGAGALILVAVLLLAAYALWGPRNGRAWAAGTRFIVAGGVAFPVVALSALLVHTFGVERTLLGYAGAPEVKIKVIGHQWWWRVQYLGADGAVDFITANEIRIPAGKPIELALESADVIHSFGVPNLAGKLDMTPGRVTRMALQAHAAGTYRGQCVEYCGGPHAKMAFYVIAEEPAAFERWRASQRAAASRPADAAAQQGEALFMKQCASCHTVRGTEARGVLGPDLTHLASRTTVGAGILPMDRATLASWISASQTLKPGNLMPSMSALAPQDLQALAAYLEGLR